MRFMIIRRADKNTEAGGMPSEEILEAMARYNEEMVKAGVMVSGDGLKPSSQGARVKFTAGRPRVIDGPFAETKELIAGYSVIDVKSKEEAIEWVKRWPAFDVEENVEIEIRPFYELSDFGSSEAVEHHARLRDQLEGRVEGRG
jgi:PhnB protein